MRCINCGYADNPAGRTTCAQCGQPLVADNYGPQFYEQPYQRGGYQKSGNFDDAQRTRVFRQSDLDAISRKEEEAQAPKQCPRCHYPVLEGYKICPNCGTELKKGTDANDARNIDVEEKFPCNNCGQEVSINYAFCPHCGQKVHQPTVKFNKRKHIKPEPLPEYKCSLTIIPEEDEDMEPIRNDYKGPEVKLKRDNTEPKNRTITSKGQALLECDESGQWFISNQSEQGTTVLQITRKTPLQDGDIIMLGDRSFRFETEAPEQA